MRHWTKYGLFLLVILILVVWIGGFVGKKIGPREISVEPKVVDNLTIAQVEVQDETESAFVGHIVADKRAEISTKIAGRVKAVYVKEGDFVNLGKLLVKLDGEEIEAQVSSMEYQILQAEQSLRSALANYEAVKKTYDRYFTLHREGAVTQQEFDQISAQYESAKAQVEQAKAGIKAVQQQKRAIMSNLKYTSLTAPFSGYVVSKNVDPGDLALPGRPLLTLEAPPYFFEVFLPEKMIGRVNLGNIYKIFIPSVDRTIEGSVVEVSPNLDPATKTFRIKLKLKNATDVRSGMYGNLLIPEGTRVLLVPESAVVRRYDFTGVWVVREDSTLELRYIKLGEKRGDKYEVQSGLKPGERIVVNGTERACDGCKVRS